MAETKKSQVSPFSKSHEVNLSQVIVARGFWADRLAMNRDHALLHQWRMLEEWQCIDNFRIAAGEKQGFREGFYYADSDAYKWAEAVAIVLATTPTPKLLDLLDQFIATLKNAQMPDGYLYTYNQLHFPGARWTNLQFEHELYCHGHLIEASIAHFLATHSRAFINLGIKAADLIVKDFKEGSPLLADGHEEIEIALLRLYRLTQNRQYLETAVNILDRRGRVPHFGWEFLKQLRDKDQRKKVVKLQRKTHYGGNVPSKFDLRENVRHKEARWLFLRSPYVMLTGKYNQQHVPIREMRVPEGHCVRWGYLATAIAMLYREIGDRTLLDPFLQAWDRMVSRRMYFTGGVGCLPTTEGFGYDYELDNQYAYVETCGALASMLWDWELLLATGDAKYADLFEWQLYNAASAGISLDGQAFFFCNALESDGQITRKPWFGTPCCPSNLSRIWASLGKYMYSQSDSQFFIHQYVESILRLPNKQIILHSDFPWQGNIRVEVRMEFPAEFELNLRIPHWTSTYDLQVNQKSLSPKNRPQDPQDQASAAAFSPHQSYYHGISRTWSSGDVVELRFPMDIQTHHAHPKVSADRGKIALSRGPLVYCFEGWDNPNINLLHTTIDLHAPIHATFEQDLLGGLWVLEGKSTSGQKLRAIPYYAWANRGSSQMCVWIMKE